MVPKYAATKWQHDSFISSYKENVVMFSSILSLPCNVSDIVTKQDVQCFVDAYSDSISGVLHDAAAAVNASCSCRISRRKHHHWWNQNCKVPKRRHKFWYHLWNSCDRPREGAVYESYKHAKFVFRKTCF